MPTILQFSIELIIFKQNIVLFCSHFFHFDNIYGNHISKILCLGFLTLTSIITSPILCSIIVYEKNSSYRTLINQMVSSMMWNALAYNLIMTPLTLIFYIMSPINSPVVCRMYFMVNTVICYHMIFLLDAMIIIKYMFIFHLKNPTAVQDDFWKLWINLWTFMYCLLTEIVFHTMPGKDVPRISICIGNISLKQVNGPYKFPGHIGIALVMTFLIHVGFHLLHKTYKLFGLKKFHEYKIYKIQFSSTNQDTLFSFVTTLVAVLLCFCAHAFSTAISSLHPLYLDTYPYYLMEYALENLIPSGAILIFLITHLYKHRATRRAVWNEVKQITCCPK